MPTERKFLPIVLSSYCPLRKIPKTLYATTSDDDWKNATMSSAPSKARGVLRPQLPQGEFWHERLQPCAALADLVEHFWFVQWDLRDLPPQQQATLPHPNVHLVVERGDARIYGVHTDRFDRTLEGYDFAFGIKFKPAGFQPYLRAPVATLANSSISARTVFADIGKVIAQNELEALRAQAERLLLEAVPPSDHNVAQANHIVAAIAADLSLTSVEQVQAMAGMDKRSLQRLFQKYVGIGPKWVIKRYRMHEAVAQVQTGASISWAELAIELGYFDQAHFIRDFRALVGQTPTDYVRSITAMARHE
jgi:AraC-like DNA-binding protein